MTVPHPPPVSSWELKNYPPTVSQLLKGRVLRSNHIETQNSENQVVKQKQPFPLARATNKSLSTPKSHFWLCRPHIEGESPQRVNTAVLLLLLLLLSITVDSALPTNHQLRVHSLPTTFTIRHKSYYHFPGNPQVIFIMTRPVHGKACCCLLFVGISQVSSFQWIRLKATLFFKIMRIFNKPPLSKRVRCVLGFACRLYMAISSVCMKKYCLHM